MNNKNGLKPCPFCGKNPTSKQFGALDIWTIVCKCGCESPRDSSSESGAKRIWNRRRHMDINLSFLNEYDKMLLSDRAKKKGMSFNDYMLYIVNKSLTLTEDKV